MITIKNLTVKNFMSVGNATQAVNFDRQDLTLVLGDNLDLGANGSKNGTGKTTLINALSYGFYGNALTNIRVNNLINKTNEKNMLVSVDFMIDSDEYRIERGRKPNLLKFYKNNNEIVEDEAQGDSRETQKEIEKLLNLSHDMFKHAVALNTYTEPFLSMRANDQKNIIEQLLGITVLTEKAEALKIANKSTKDDIKEEDFRLEAILKSNEHIKAQIDNLESRKVQWQNKKDTSIAEYCEAIAVLKEVDIDKEIQKHKDNVEAREAAKTEWYGLTEANQKTHDEAMALYIAEKEKITEHNASISKHNADIIDTNKWIAQIETEQKSITRRCTALEKDIKLIDEHKCHSCGQDLHDEIQEENKKAKWEELGDLTVQFEGNGEQEAEYKLQLAELGVPKVQEKLPVQPVIEVVDRIIPEHLKTFYDNVDDAHGHKSSLDTLSTQLETATEEKCPYTEQIKDMTESGIQDANYDEMNRLDEMQEHQAFLLKLLTSKDSFIRKKIIEQNLAYLNNRLTYYLDEIGLPHQVRFMSDLTVEITDMGRELDFDNLSRGERNRLILSLSWAFRDVWESLYSHINLLFVDELVDSGLDSTGVEAAIKIMKSMARERHKSVWLVSHREELISRVHNTIMVIKENGFTSYEGIAD